jgi:NAD(P)-dependent dehydrogenase (short-subunit alcohol dehydrogenase family)
MDLQLRGKHAIVTGGSRGLGKRIAWQLAEEGVDVVIAARNREPLEAAAAEISNATGRRVVPVVVNVDQDASVDAMVDNAVLALG